MTRDPRPPLPVREVSDLRGLLARFGVDTSTWGTGEAKTVDHLLEEIRSGDSELVVEAAGIARRVRNVWIDVFATTDSGRLHLVERRQVFGDGRQRMRRLPASLGEKCRVGEEPLVAARRGFAEELGIGPPAVLAPTAPGLNPTGRTSYPTLATSFESHWFRAEIDPADYRPDGYVEVQPDKQTFFEWEPVRRR